MQSEAQDDSRARREHATNGDARWTRPTYWALVLCCALGTCGAGADISVSPISAALDLSRSGSHLITIRNVSADSRVPIKVSAHSWALDTDGRDVRADTDDLVMFPGQFILSPGEQRAVRVAPRLNKAPPVESSYRVIVRELPIDLDSSANPQTGVRLVTAYATAFYVLPEQPRSDVQFTQVVRDGATLVFTLRNDGNTHSHLRKLALEFTQGERRARIEAPAQLQRFYGENLLAGSQRRFRWRWPVDVDTDIDLKSVSDVSLEFDCEYCDGARQELKLKLR